MKNYSGGVLLTLAAGVLGMTLAAGPAMAQAGGQQPPAGGQSSPLDKPVNINLRDIPLKSALELLFQGTGLNYAVDPTVPNVLLTINLKDQPLRTALRTLIHLAASQVPGLTFSEEAGLYIVKIRAPAPPETQQPEQPPVEADQAQDLIWEKIPINYTSAQLLAVIFGGMNIPDETMMSMGGMGGGMMGGMGGMGGGMMGGMGGMGGGMMGGMGGMMGGMGGMGGGLGGIGGGLGGIGGGLGGGGLGGLGGGLGGGFGGGLGGGIGGGGRRF